MLSPQLEPGTIFAQDYRIVRYMASGGMGTIYEVEQLSTCKLRALKVMHPTFANDPKHRERFESEAKIASQIESDHVIEVLAAGLDEASGVPWLVMELLRGETLDELVQRAGPRPWEEVCEMARQLHHVLKRAHQRGLLHLDLKPENIFVALPRRLDVPFTLKVLDFGIARWAQQAQKQATVRTSQIIGSPLWMAPEQLQAGAELSPAADVWALGLIFFYVLTAKTYWPTGNSYPFSVGPVVTEVLLDPMPPASVRASELQCPVGLLPEGFDGWFDRATCRDARQRFGSGDVALEEFVALLSPQGVIESRPSVVLSKERYARYSEPPQETRLDLDAALEQAAEDKANEAEMALRLARVFELQDSHRSRAIEAYQRVLALVPNCAEAYAGLKALYRRVQLHAPLADLLQAELEHCELDDGQSRQRWLDLAELWERELGQVENARRAWYQALALEPTAGWVLQGCAEFLSRQGAWEEALRVLQRGLADLEQSATAGPQAQLLCKLAELCLEHPELEPLAVDALERAAQLEHRTVELETRLARLYSQLPSPSTKQVLEHWRQALLLDSAQQPAWIALWEAYQAQGWEHEAWSLAEAAEAVLGQATPEPLRDYVKRNGAGQQPSARGHFSGQLFARLAQDLQLDPRPGRVFALLLEPLQKLRARPLEQLGLPAEELIDPITCSRARMQQVLPVYQALLGAGAELDVPSMPTLYFRPEAPMGLTHVPSQPWASLAGGGFATSWGPSEWAFMAGKHMTYYRSELYACVLLPTAAMLAKVYARALQLVHSPLSPNPLAKELSAEELDLLRTRLQRVLGNSAEPEPDLELWHRTVVRLSARVGLLLGGQLQKARRVLETVGKSSGPLSAREQFDDLVRFTVSDCFRQLRQRQRGEA